jgi:aspartate/methionine/tyrosine aminotransferase
MTSSMLAANLPSLQISERVQNIPEALSIYINQLVYDLRRRGHDVTALSLGEAFFDIPLFDFRKLDVQKSYHYSDSQGIPELRKKIADYYTRHYGAPVEGTGEVLITAGSKPAIFMVMETVLNPGDEVLIHEPGWLSYKEQASLAGAISRFIPYDCPIRDFPVHFGPRTRLLVINNPNNPAGRVYTRQELTDIYRMCRERGIYVLVDEAYSDFVIDERFVSMAEIVPDKDGVIVVNSLSKNMGISGWRVGYIIAHPQLVSAILKVNQHLITCAPTILLYYIARYFDQIIAVTLPQVREVVEKRKRVAAMIDEIGLERLPGGSTFYFFVSLGDFPGSALDFSLHMLLNYNIAIVPGSAYGASTHRFIRISIGTESEERIFQALQLIRDSLNGNGADQDSIDRRLADLGAKRFHDAGH